MKRLLLIAVPLGLMFFGGVASSAEGPATPERTLTVFASAPEDYTPDTAEITLGVEETAKSAEAAAKAVSVRAERVIAAVKGLILDGETLRTSSYGVDPVYEYDNARGKNTLSVYRAQNLVTVKTRNLKAVGEMLDVAIRSGANRVDGLRFSISDDGPYCANALSKAAKKATLQAEAGAKAFKMSLKGVKRIAPSCASQHMPPVFNYAAEAMSADRQRASTPIEPGIGQVIGTVEAIFYIGE